jgi:hypothetical protein
VLGSAAVGMRGRLGAASSSSSPRMRMPVLPAADLRCAAGIVLGRARLALPVPRVDFDASREAAAAQRRVRLAGWLNEPAAAQVPEPHLLGEKVEDGGAGQRAPWTQQIS